MIEVADYTTLKADALPISLGPFLAASILPQSNIAPPPTTDPIPESEWNDMYDGGVIFNGGDAFGGKLVGIAFEVITTSGGYDFSHEQSDNADSGVNVTHAVPDRNTVVDSIIITGKIIAKEFEIAGLLARMTPSVLDDAAFAIGQVMFDDQPHSYNVVDQVGDTACDADEAWTAIKAFGAFPGQISPVTNGAVSNVSGLGPIKRYINEASMTITNVAQPGHILYPGNITRQVIVDAGKVYIKTTGVGEGQFGGANSLFSEALWGNLDNNVAKYVDYNDNDPDDC